MRAVSSLFTTSFIHPASLPQLNVEASTHSLVYLILTSTQMQPCFCAWLSAQLAPRPLPAGPTIPTAVNIPLDMLSDAVRAGQLDPYHTSSIAVVCASGQRSAQATVRLSKVFGFSNVSNLAGGMAAWQALTAAGGGGGGGGCGCGGGGSGGCSK